MATGTQVKQDDDDEKHNQSDVIGIAILLSTTLIRHEEGGIVHFIDTHTKVTSTAFVIIDAATHRESHNHLFD